MLTIPQGETHSSDCAAGALPLTEKDRRDLAFMRRSPEAMSRLPEGVTAESSDETLAHAVFEKGLEAVKEEEAKRAYAALTADRPSLEAARAARNRRRPLAMAIGE